MNQDLKDLHDTLIAQHQALFKELDDVTDPDDARAIVTEMQELLHRINVLQGLLFTQTTGALKASLAKVSEADDELTKALKAAAKTADVIKGVAKFLVAVDKAIDLAKTLAIA